jgi:fermentation-respiration switch protein FrsA (DUF1100 family)
MTQGERTADVEATQPGRSGKPRWRRGMIRVGQVVGLLYVGLCAVLYALQTRFIFPGSDTQGDPMAEVRPGPGAELVTLTTAGGERVVALFGTALNPDGSPHPDAAKCPTVLFFYGNGMCLSATADHLFEMFRRLGANVMIPDYVGYGLSGGSPSEAGCYATADTTYEHLRGRKDVDPARIVAAGWSLGGGVAVDLAARRRVAGLAVFSTFTSLVDMARQSFPFLPGSLLLRHRFDSIPKIGKVTVPVLVGHGRVDSIVPHAMSERLAAAATSAPKVTRYTVEGADHNDFFMVGEGETVARLRAFLDALR